MNMVKQYIVRICNFKDEITDIFKENGICEPICDYNYNVMQNLQLLINNGFYIQAVDFLYSKSIIFHKMTESETEIKERKMAEYLKLKEELNIND